MQKRNTKRVGDISEIAAIYAFGKNGYRVSIPFGENNRYDLIVETPKGSLARVQVKTGRLRDGAILFSCYSSHIHRGGALRRYVGEIDLFAVYCPQTDAVYIVPIEDVDEVHQCSLRVAMARNGQTSRVRSASHYLLSAGTPKLVGPEPGLGVRSITEGRRSSVVEHDFGKVEAAGSIPADG